MSMDRKKYHQLRVVVTLFVSVIVSLSVTSNSYLLALVGVLSGLLFLTLVRSKAKITVDERESSIQEKAARMTYAIFTPTLGIGAFLLLIPSQGELFPVFAKGDFLFLESLGMIFAYLTLFLIFLYAISYHFLNRKYGGGADAE